MRLFGDFLPFLGFRVMPVDNEGFPSEIGATRWESDCFVIEWRSHVVVFFTTNIREADGQSHKPS